MADGGARFGRAQDRIEQTELGLGLNLGLGLGLGLPRVSAVSY